MGIAYFYGKKYNEALENFKESLKIRKNKIGDSNLIVGQTLNYLGLVYCELNDLEQSIQF